jgi:hypothetical protein
MGDCGKNWCSGADCACHLRTANYVPDAEAKRLAAHEARRGPGKKKPKAQKPSREEVFRLAVKKFVASGKTDEATFDLMVAFWKATRPDAGLVFSEVKRIVQAEVF